jgi:sugar phosphate isomerase/epimerase
MALKFSDFSSGAALAEKGLEIAQRVGKWGIPGVVIYDLGAVVRLVIHPSWEAVEGACSTIGISLVLIAILASVKRGNEITVNAAVDAKEDRVAIAAAVGAPVVQTTVKDKAIQSEINTRLAADPTEAARLTPLEGTPVQRGGGG